MQRDAAARARAQSASVNGNGIGVGLASSDTSTDEEVRAAVRTLRDAQHPNEGRSEGHSATRLVAAAQGADARATDDVDADAVPSLHGSADGDAEGLAPLASRDNAHMKAAGALEVLARQRTAAPASRAERAKAARVRAGARQRPVR